MGGACFTSNSRSKYETTISKNGDSEWVKSEKFSHNNLDKAKNNQNNKDDDKDSYSLSECYIGKKSIKN
jgi:hypothetical protein